MAALMCVGVAATLFADEPPRRGWRPRTISPTRSCCRSSSCGSGSARGLHRHLAFAATYKFGEQFAQVLTMPFYQARDPFHEH